MLRLMPRNRLFVALLFLASVHVPASAQNAKPDPVLTEDQIRAMDRPEAMQYILDTYKDQLDRIIQKVKTHTPAQYRSRVKNARIEYETDETPFSFYKDPETEKTVHISLGGINALDSSAVALAASVFVLHDESWWLRYLLYHRELRRHPNTVWADPLDAAGISRENVPAEISSDMAHSAYRSLDGMLTFVVAHEFGHVALNHDGEQGDEENSEVYLARIRRQEEEADAFALQVADSADVDPFAVLFTLLTHFVVFEDSTSYEGVKHPADNWRAAHAIDYYTRQKQERHRTFVDAAKDLSGNLNDHDALDQLANTITLQSLKQYDGKIPSFERPATQRREMHRKE